MSFELKKIFGQIESVSYTCKHCGHEENISELDCAHCHKKGTVTFDKNKGYPVVCLGCRDKGLYVTCSKCKEAVYHGTFKIKNYLPIVSFVAVTLFVGVTLAFILAK